MCPFHLPVRGLSHHVNLAQLALELLQKPTKITAREARNRDSSKVSKQINCGDRSISATVSLVYTQETVSLEVNPHGIGQYCARCGARGQSFSLRAGQRITGRGSKLFWCPHCHCEAQADLKASVNIHHSFYREYHWHPPPKRNG